MRYRSQVQLGSPCDQATNDHGSPDTHWNALFVPRLPPITACVNPPFCVAIEYTTLLSAAEVTLATYPRRPWANENQDSGDRLGDAYVASYQWPFPPEDAGHSVNVPAPAQGELTARPAASAHITTVQQNLCRETLTGTIRS